MRSKQASALLGKHRPPEGARARHRLGEPRVSQALVRALRALGGAYARLGLKLGDIEFRHPERALEALTEFRAGKSRLILAFRHPYGDEPQLLTLALAYGLERAARRSGAPSPGLVHARFVHGYEVPLWSGPLVRWLLPRVGAMPVYHSRLDRAGLERIRAALRDGAFPLALAPEGQSSYRSETVPRLEQGTARLAFWCAGDLRKQGRQERVEVLPLAVNYQYDEADIGRLERLVAALEADCGLASPRGGAAGDRGAGAARRLALCRRLAALDLALIAQTERYYHGARGERPSLDRDVRLALLIEEALRRAEAVLGIKAEGDSISRVYAIRQEGWDRIYPEEGTRSLSPLGRRLADRRAGEAWFAMRHMEFVDLCYYLDSGYFRVEGGEAPSFGRLVETAYSAADLASRLCGGNISHRPNILRHRAVLSVGRKLDLGARYEDYVSDGKGAIETATRELEREYKLSIEEYIHGQES
jgi:hypothetical protein